MPASTSLSQVKAARGTTLRCQSWRTEAILRMLENNLENAERAQDLVVYGGTGKAARSWDDYHAIVAMLKRLKDDETLVVQSGRPVGIFRTLPTAPRILIANSNLVPAWSTWDVFNRLEKQGLIMYGQMTAGSWCYIGTQGIVQGTYETFAALAKKHFAGTLKGRIVLTAGLGGMGGAQPLAVTLNDGVCLAIEVDETRARRRLEKGWLDEITSSVDEAIAKAKAAAKAGTPLSIGLIANASEAIDALLAKGLAPHVVTDQTSAHDALNGYIPGGMSIGEALALRTKDPEAYVAASMKSMADHMRAMLKAQRAGAIVFDYGNNIRGQAQKAGVSDAFDVKGFVPLYVRPLFEEGRGPFRWLALTGEAQDIRRTDAALLKMFPDNPTLTTWIQKAQAKVPFEGLPARVCWLGLGERDRFALELNAMVRRKEIGPVAITRDHLDSGSVASPNRETEGMKDGSDAVADWPLLNALLNTAAGADSVQIHNGGGVGIGLSTHAGMVVVCDGSSQADERIRRVFRTDPGMGVLRHASAGYAKAKATGKAQGLDSPLLD
jgi:urocanate hydratase